jgi:hypothetical protein
VEEVQLYHYRATKEEEMTAVFVSSNMRLTEQKNNDLNHRTLNVKMTTTF